MPFDYKKNDPVGFGGVKSRGAALGRPHITDEPKEYTGFLSVQRVRINSDGYDKNGTYFGHGGPLYWCANEECTVDFVVRARDRESALKQVLKEYPNAKVRR